MTTLQRYLPYALVVVCVLAAVWYIHTLDVQRVQDQAKYESTMQQQGAIISDLQKRMEQRDAETQAAKDALAKQQSDAKTTQQQLALIASRLQLPQPLTVNVPPNPTQPVTVTAPQQDVTSLMEYTTECEQCKVQLPTLQADLADVKKQLKATETERDAAVQMAKGGSMWTRIKRSAKWIAVGGLVGIAATCGSGHCK